MVKDLGTVDSFYDHGRGLISPGVRPGLPARKPSRSSTSRPAASNFCVGTTPDQIAPSGDPVALYPCGASASTDLGPGHQPERRHRGAGYSVYVNGETDSFSNPLVLNYPARQPDRHAPRAAGTSQPLSTYSSADPFSGSVYDNQQWNGIGGSAAATAGRDPR